MISATNLQAWEAWDQGTVNELLDRSVAEPKPEILFELERCVQIGLLCVQQSPEHRPTMAAVVTMLNNNSSQIPPPKTPVPEGRTGSPLCGADRSSTQEASGTSRDSHTVYFT